MSKLMYLLIFSLDSNPTDLHLWFDDLGKAKLCRDLFESNDSVNNVSLMSVKFL